MGEIVRYWMVLFWMTLVASGAMAAAPEVLRAEFGLFTPRHSGDSDETLFEPARIVPHKVGTRYGWVIELRTDKRRLDVSEEYLLPAPRPAGASEPDARVLSFARRNPVSHRRLAPRDGLIFGEWEIGPGEPPGQRHLQVLVEGEVVAEFEYEVR